jgi:glycosyltransferase involved in cell wall biosynthesis
MKLLFFCEGFDKSNMVAQPWRHMYEMAKMMKTKGNDVKILTDCRSNLPEKEVIDGLSVQRIKRERIFLNCEQLLQNLDSSDVDLINWYGGPLSAIYFWRMRNSLKKNIVWNLYKAPTRASVFGTVKNLRLKELLSFSSNVTLLYLLCPSFIIKRGADVPQIKRIITWSELSKDYLSDIGLSSKKVMVVPSGVNVDIFKIPSDEGRNTLKLKWGFDPTSSIILYFGLLSSLRGVDVLLSSFSKVSRKFPNTRLLILGRQSQDFSRLEKRYFEEADKSGKVTFLQATQPLSVVTEALGLADLVVLPFKFWPYQDCPLTILEAMAMEKPVITTLTGSIPEIVENGKTGILVPPGDTESLCQAILKLLSDKTASRQMGRQARAHVEKFYDWNVILEQTTSIFQELCN